jgi:transaldolase
MKLFLDSANLGEIRAVLDAASIDGLTTNPTLIAREAVVLEEFVPAACALVQGPVSVPVRSTTADEMVLEGRTLAALHDDVVVKIGIDPAGLRAMAKLHSEGIRTHATLCSSAAQALLAARAGAYFVSPLLGRLEDCGVPALDLVAQIIEIYDNYEFDTQIMVASVRSVWHVQEVARLGADAATLPRALLDALARHPLTDSLQERFQADWKRR